MFTILSEIDDLLVTSTYTYIIYIIDLQNTITITYHHAHYQVGPWLDL